jgi:quinol monooxygenase YgiN
MHAVACFVTPDPDKREELLQTLRSLAQEIRSEPGCVVCSVCLEEASAYFIVVSGWQTDADLRRHLHSEHFRVLSGASRLLGASAEVGFLASGVSFDSTPTGPTRSRGEP